MARTVAIGVQNFEKIISNDRFYIDKTDFIKDWWESGFGRYDVMLKPLNETDNAIIIEFKIYNPKKEQNMEETVKNALQQIVDKHYGQALLEQGIHAERIRKYGFAFRGKEVLIGT